VLDATRVADNVKVVLKSVKLQQEVNLTHEFGKDLQEKSPNANVQPLDVIHLQDDSDIIAILVLPFLWQFDDLPFKQLYEVKEALE
jgi:hypothetical protein